MKRIYDTLIPTDTATMFIGEEVEHTPMKGQPTLFVVGIQSLETVIETLQYHELQHVYLGANQSFVPDDAWEDLVKGLLNEGFWVTLDFDVQEVEWIHECLFTEHNRFIPMISVKLPYIDLLGYNACLKLDDKDFDATNSGVWTHQLHDLKDRRVFTDWSKYTQDTIIR